MKRKPGINLHRVGQRSAFNHEEYLKAIQRMAEAAVSPKLAQACRDLYRAEHRRLLGGEPKRPKLLG